MRFAPVVAHRGLARIFPENTRAAVLGALSAGLGRVEIDVQLSSDGVPVLQHDADLLRMTGKAGDLRRLPYARLRTLAMREPGRFGDRFRGERLCSLEDLALALAPLRFETLFVELKEESLRRFGRAFMLRAVAEAVAPIQRRCALISFDAAALELARGATRFAVAPVLRSWEQWRGGGLRPLGADWVFCDRRLLPKQGSLKAAFGRSRACVYEVAEAGEARRLFQRGVTAVETLRGDTLAQELALFA
jgi:glycerophosphoryl diester phosphodiesterase